MTGPGGSRFGAGPAGPAEAGQADGPAAGADARVAEALTALAAGLPVLVTDDEDRENEGDVVLAAATASTRWVGWTVRHTSGVLCAPMTGERADLLGLPPMVAENEDPKGTAYTVSVDAVGVGTGIGAADRTHTLRTLADPATTRDDLTRPGHVLPLRARAGGVLERRGHTEAAVDLCRLAGLPPVGMVAELVDDEGALLRRPAILELGRAHDLPVLTVADVARHRDRHDRVDRLAETSLPTAHGRFTAYAYRDRVTGAEHLALVSPAGLGGDRPLARVHSECLTGDVLGSRRCDCGPQLDRALEVVARDGGAVVYLRGHEGRGVGLVDKMRAYALQDTGVDTVDAQTRLGLPVDAREFASAAAILLDLGLARPRLLTNNPAKTAALRERGLDVEPVGLSLAPHADNERYLRAKRDRLGHAILLEEPGAQAGAVSTTGSRDHGRASA